MSHVVVLLSAGYTDSRQQEIVDLFVNSRFSVLAFLALVAKPEKKLVLLYVVINAKPMHDTVRWLGAQQTTAL